MHASLLKISYRLPLCVEPKAGSVLVMVSWQRMRRRLSHGSRAKAYEASARFPPQGALFFFGRLQPGRPTIMFMGISPLEPYQIFSQLAPKPTSGNELYMVLSWEQDEHMGKLESNSATAEFGVRELQVGSSIRALDRSLRTFHRAMQVLFIAYRRQLRDLDLRGPMRTKQEWQIGVGV